jgi:uncharacterized protein (DUF983 family)
VTAHPGDSEPFPPRVEPPAGGWSAQIDAALRGRCPACRTGRIFQSFWNTHRACPHCGLLFEREHGYYTGAMYLSYALGIPLILLFTLCAWLLFPGWQLWQLVLLAWAVFLPIAPFVYRASRVLWLHLDHVIDQPAPGAPPSPTTAGQIAAQPSPASSSRPPQPPA